MAEYVLRALVSATALAAVAAMPLAARAQQAGVYSGTTADGNTITFTIGTDSNTGALQVTALGFGLTDTCNPGGFTYSTGWGLGGDGTDLTGSTGTYNYTGYGYLYVSATLKFTGNTLTGTILNATPTLIQPTTAGSEPKKAAYCSGKKQKFIATYSASAAKMPGRPVGITYGGTVSR